MAIVGAASGRHCRRKYQRQRTAYIVVEVKVESGQITCGIVD
jgi:hypothetical protein